MNFPISTKYSFVRNIDDCYRLCYTLAQECVLFEIRNDYEKAYKKWMNLHTFITSSISSFKKHFPMKLLDNSKRNMDPIEFDLFQSLSNLDKQAINGAHLCFEIIVRSKLPKENDGNAHHHTYSGGNNPAIFHEPQNMESNKYHTPANSGVKDYHKRMQISTATTLSGQKNDTFTPQSHSTNATSTQLNSNHSGFIPASITDRNITLLSEPRINLMNYNESNNDFTEDGASIIASKSLQMNDSSPIHSEICLSLNTDFEEGSSSTKSNNTARDHDINENSNINSRSESTSNQTHHPGSNNTALKTVPPGNNKKPIISHSNQLATISKHDVKSAQIINNQPTTVRPTHQYGTSKSLNEPIVHSTESKGNSIPTPSNKDLHSAFRLSIPSEYHTDIFDNKVKQQAFDDLLYSGKNTLQPNRLLDFDIAAPMVYLSPMDYHKLRESRLRKSMSDSDLLSARVLSVYTSQSNLLGDIVSMVESYEEENKGTASISSLSRSSASSCVDDMESNSSTDNETHGKCGNNQLYEQAKNNIILEIAPGRGEEHRIVEHYQTDPKYNALLTDDFCDEPEGSEQQLTQNEEKEMNHRTGNNSNRLNEIMNGVHNSNNIHDFVAPLSMNTLLEHKRSSDTLKKLMDELHLEKGEFKDEEDNATIFTELDTLTAPHIRNYTHPRNSRATNSSNRCINNIGIDMGHLGIEQEFSAIDLLKSSNHSSMILLDIHGPPGTLKSVRSYQGSLYRNTFGSTANLLDIPFSDLPQGEFQVNEIPEQIFDNWPTAEIPNHKQTMEVGKIEKRIAIEDATINNFESVEDDVKEQQEFSAAYSESVLSASVIEKVEDEYRQPQTNRDDELETNACMITNGSTLPSQSKQNKEMLRSRKPEQDFMKEKIKTEFSRIPNVMKIISNDTPVSRNKNFGNGYTISNSDYSNKSGVTLNVKLETTCLQAIQISPTFSHPTKFGKPPQDAFVKGKINNDGAQSLGTTLTKFNDTMINSDVFSFKEPSAPHSSKSRPFIRQKLNLPPLPRTEKTKNFNKQQVIKGMQKTLEIEKAKYLNHLDRKDGNGMKLVFGLNGTNEKSNYGAQIAKTSPIVTFFSANSLVSGIATPNGALLVASERSTIKNPSRKPQMVTASGGESTYSTYSTKKKTKEKIEKLLLDTSNYTSGEVDERTCRSLLKIALHNDNNKISLTDLVGIVSSSTKKSLKETLIFPFLRPDLFDGLLSETVKSMLFYGPPGNRQGMIAKAVARECKCVPLVIDTASLVTHEKFVKSLFLLARKMSPITIVLENIDLLFERKPEVARVKARFFKEWKRMLRLHTGGKKSGTSSSSSSSSTPLSPDFNIGSDWKQDVRVLLLATTNKPWVIDEASCEMFGNKQYIAIPDFETRNAFFKDLVNTQQQYSLKDVDFRILSTMTSGYSIDDMLRLVKEASMGPLRQLGDDLITTSKQDIRPVGMQDFHNGLRVVKKSASMDTIQRFENWGH